MSSEPIPVRDGVCAKCGQPRPLFGFHYMSGPWGPVTVWWLCVRDWSDADQRSVDNENLFDHLDEARSEEWPFSEGRAPITLEAAKVKIYTDAEMGR